MIRNLLSACAEHGIPIESMLSTAVEPLDRSFRLLAGVPLGTRLRLGRSDRPGLAEQANVMRRPNVLVLEPEHCAQLRLCGRALVTAVRRGYVSNSDHDLREANPQSADDRLPIRASRLGGDHAFKLWDQWLVGTSTRPLELRHFDLLVTGETLEAMLLFYRRGATSPHDWASKELRIALEAAKLFWGSATVSPTQKHTHPTPHRIRSWLTREHGLSATAAADIVDLIRPEFAKKPGPAEK